MAKRYGKLPHELRDLEPVDLLFNIDAAFIGNEAEQEAMRRELERLDKLRPGGKAPMNSVPDREQVQSLLARLPKGSPARKRYEEAMARRG